MAFFRMGVMSTHKVLLADIHDHLLCTLCGGYLIDATTINKCLHTFCRACILHHVQVCRACPVCDEALDSEQPHNDLRRDNTIQRLAYKLVPNLYINELKRRREFTSAHDRHRLSVTSRTSHLNESTTTITTRFGHVVPQTSNNLMMEMSDTTQLTSDTSHVIADSNHVSRVIPSSPRTGHYFIYTPTDRISIGLQLRSRTSADRLRSRTVHLLPTRDKLTEGRRYLLCPAAVNIGLVKKFISLKLDLKQHQQVELYHSGECLRDNYTLIDIAYIFSWTKKSPLIFDYLITTRSQQRPASSLSSSSSRTRGGSSTPPHPGRHRSATLQRSRTQARSSAQPSSLQSSSSFSRRAGRPPRRVSIIARVVDGVQRVDKVENSTDIKQPANATSLSDMIELTRYDRKDSKIDSTQRHPESNNHSTPSSAESTLCEEQSLLPLDSLPTPPLDVPPPFLPPLWPGFDLGWRTTDVTSGNSIFFNIQQPDLFYSVNHPSFLHLAPPLQPVAPPLQPLAPPQSWPIHNPLDINAIQGRLLLGSAETVSLGDNLVGNVAPDNAVTLRAGVALAENVNLGDGMVVDALPALVKADTFTIAAKCVDDSANYSNSTITRKCSAAPFAPPRRSKRSAGSNNRGSKCVEDAASSLDNIVTGKNMNAGIEEPCGDKCALVEENSCVMVQNAGSGEVVAVLATTTAQQSEIDLNTDTGFERDCMTSVPSTTSADSALVEGDSEEEEEEVREVVMDEIQSDVAPAIDDGPTTGDTGNGISEVDDANWNRLTPAVSNNVCVMTNVPTCDADTNESTCEDNSINSSGIMFNNSMTDVLEQRLYSTHPSSRKNLQEQHNDLPVQLDQTLRASESGAHNVEPEANCMTNGTSLEGVRSDVTTPYCTSMSGAELGVGSGLQLLGIFAQGPDGSITQIPAHCLVLTGEPGVDGRLSLGLAADYAAALRASGITAASSTTTDVISSHVTGQSTESQNGEISAVTEHAIGRQLLSDKDTRSEPEKIPAGEHVFDGQDGVFIHEEKINGNSVKQEVAGDGKDTNAVNVIVSPGNSVIVTGTVRPDDSVNMCAQYATGEHQEREQTNQESIVGVTLPSANTDGHVTHDNASEASCLEKSYQNLSTCGSQISDHLTLTSERTGGASNDLSPVLEALQEQVGPEVLPAFEANSANDLICNHVMFANEINDHAIMSHFPSSQYLTTYSSITDHTYVACRSDASDSQSNDTMRLDNNPSISSTNASKSSLSDGIGVCGHERQTTDDMSEKIDINDLQKKCHSDSVLAPYTLSGSCDIIDSIKERTSHPSAVASANKRRLSTKSRFESSNGPRNNLLSSDVSGHKPDVVSSNMPRLSISLSDSTDGQNNMCNDGATSVRQWKGDNVNGKDSREGEVGGACVGVGIGRRGVQYNCRVTCVKLSPRVTRLSARHPVTRSTRRKLSSVVSNGPIDSKRSRYVTREQQLASSDCAAAVRKQEITADEERSELGVCREDDIIMDCEPCLADSSSCEVRIDTSTACSPALSGITSSLRNDIANTASPACSASEASGSTEATCAPCSTSAPANTAPDNSTRANSAAVTKCLLNTESLGPAEVVVSQESNVVKTAMTSSERTRRSKCSSLK